MLISKFQVRTFVARWSLSRSLFMLRKPDQTQRTLLIYDTYALQLFVQQSLKIGVPNLEGVTLLWSNFSAGI